MRGSPRIMLAIVPFLLLAACATIRPGNDGFRVITEGFESQLPRELFSETKKRADTHAQQQMGVYIKDHDVARKKFADLLGLPFDHPDVIMYASRAEIIKRPTRIEAGERIAYSYAAIPLAAPNALVSGGLSVLFPGLGQFYMKRGGSGLGHFALGALGAGVTIYNYMQYDQWHAKYQKETRLDLINDYYDKSNTWFRYTQISLAAYGIVTVFSAIDAFTLAKTNQWLLDQLRQGGIKTSQNLQFMIVPQSGYLAVSLSYGL